MTMSCNPIEPSHTRTRERVLHDLRGFRTAFAARAVYEDEFTKLSNSWDTLLGPYLK